jgi:hypothetical protein
MKALGITQNVVADSFRVDRMAESHSYHFDEWFVRADSLLGEEIPELTEDKFNAAGGMKAQLPISLSDLDFVLSV